MPESMQNAMAACVLTRNNRDPMASATTANSLRTVTPRRSTRLNNEYSLRRSPCRWLSRAPHNYEGVDTEILIVEPNHGNNGVQQMSNSFRVWPTAEVHETKGNPNENRRRYIPVLFFEAVCEGICSRVCCNLLQTRKSADSASRGVRPIALVMREQIGKRWTRITRIRRQSGAEKQVLTTPSLFCPTHANAGKVTARDEIERGLGQVLEGYAALRGLGGLGT